MFRIISVATLTFLISTSAPLAADFFKAGAYCSIAKVTGYSEYFANRQSAVDSAVQNCTQKGGVESCCRNQSRIVDIKVLHDAVAYCSIKKVWGRAVRKNYQEAVDYAVARCVGKGGIVGCCRNNITVK